MAYCGLYNRTILAPSPKDDKWVYDILKEFFYQNDCFLENGGTSKIRLLQCYLVPTLDSCYCRNLKQIYKLKSLAPDIPKAQTS